MLSVACSTNFLPVARISDIRDSTWRGAGCELSVPLKDEGELSFSGLGRWWGSRSEKRQVSDIDLNQRRTYLPLARVLSSPACTNLIAKRNSTRKQQSLIVLER